MEKIMQLEMNRKLGHLLFKSKKRYKVAYGGRGSGKSIGFGIAVIQYAIKNPNSKILCVRGTQVRISDSSLQILKDVIDMMGVGSLFDITEHTLTCKNGTRFLFYGAVAYQAFKSLQGINLCWIDEATELKEEAWEWLTPSIREDDSELLVTFNPEYVEDPVYQKFIVNERDDTDIVMINWNDNKYFPKVLKSEMEYDKKHRYAKYLHIWEGQLREDIEGALWNAEMFNYLGDDERAEMIKNKYRIFEKIVVALDPSGTSNQNSDACGIVVVGKYSGLNRWCILEDITAIMSPIEWATKSIALYQKYNANKIVYETNYGGDMIPTVIKGVDRYIPLEGVRATKGKMLRAEPIVVLYEQGLVDHYDRFTSLEYEMTTFNGDPKQKSPNRLDAAVWGLTYLSGKVGRKMSVPNVSLY